jgi:hypothetical protein
MSFNIASEELVCVLNLYNKVNVKEKKFLFTNSTLEKCKDSETVFRFRHESSFCQIKIPACLSGTASYHAKCYSNYTSVSQEEIKNAKLKSSELQKVLESVVL